MRNTTSMCFPGHCVLFGTDMLLILLLTPR